MKINERNTALHLLRDSEHLPIGIRDEAGGMQEAIHFLRHGFKAMRPGVRQRIQYVSHPFMTAYLKGRERLSRVFTDEPIDQGGTMIFPLEGIGNQTVFYQLSATQDPSAEWTVSGTIISFISSTSNPQPELFQLIRLSNRGNFAFNEQYLTDQGLPPKMYVEDFLGLLIFMKFCELETKIIFPGKTAVHVNQEYRNNTKQAVEILDSTWFTTIVRSEGFMVGAATGGFFRLQPCGPGLTQKKLVWIFPYEKHGYTRKAKLLREG